MADCTRVPILRIGENPTVSADCSQDQAARRLYDDAAKSTAYITDGRHSGSGFFIDDGSRLVTNAHVVRLHYSLFEVRAHDGNVYEARIERYDNVNDLAILKLERNKRNPNVLGLGSSGDLKSDEKVYAIGHPGGSNETYIMPGTFQSTMSIPEHYLSQKRPYPFADSSAHTTAFENDLARQRKEDQINHDDSKRLVLSIKVERGTSGGAVVDESSRAVGVVSNLGWRAGYAVPSDMVHKLLTDKPQFEFKYENQTSIRHHPVRAAFGAAIYGASFMVAPRITTGSLAIPAILNTGKHFDDAQNSTTSAEKISAYLSLTADAGFLTGAALAISSRLTPFRNTAAAIGVAAYAAELFVPSKPHLTEIVRTDINNKRIPFEWNPRSSQAYD